MICANNCPSPWKPSAGPVLGDDSYCRTTTDCAGLRMLNHYYTRCTLQQTEISVYCNSLWGICCQAIKSRCPIFWAPTFFNRTFKYDDCVCVFKSYFGEISLMIFVGYFSAKIFLN